MYAFITKLLYRVTIPLSGLWLNNSHRVRVLVVHNNEVLLQRTSFGLQQWSLPGGGVERGETVEAAAVRETAEEVGLQNLSQNQVQILATKRLPANNGWATVNISFCLIRLKQQETPHIVRPIEILEVGWFGLDKLPANRSETVDRGLAVLPAK